MQLVGSLATEPHVDQCEYAQCPQCEEWFMTEDWASSVIYELHFSKWDADEEHPFCSECCKETYEEENYEDALEA